jgi:hypothetical protein
MLELDQIQQRGFRSVKENGKVVGVQIPIKSTYYRGVYLSQLRPATVTIDGEKFENDQLTWTIGGTTYQQADFDKYSDVFWPLLETAIITVKKPGGWKLGVHEIEFSYSYSSSYMPPSMDTGLGGRPTKRKVVLVG